MQTTNLPQLYSFLLQQWLSAHGIPYEILRHPLCPESLFLLRAKRRTFAIPLSNGEVNLTAAISKLLGGR